LHACTCACRAPLCMLMMRAVSTSAPDAFFAKLTSLQKIQKNLDSVLFFFLTVEYISNGHSRSARSVDLFATPPICYDLSICSLGPTDRRPRSCSHDLSCSHEPLEVLWAFNNDNELKFEQTRLRDNRKRHTVCIPLRRTLCGWNGQACCHPCDPGTRVLKHIKVVGSILCLFSHRPPVARCVRQKEKEARHKV